MNKATKYAVNGALLFGTGNAIINAIKQYQEIKENSNLEFDWSKLLAAGAKGTLAGCATGIVVGGLIDIQNNSEKQLNTDAILKTIVVKMKLNKNDSIYKKLSRKVDILTSLIEANFKSQLGGHILRMGSTEDDTALLNNFDIDLAVFFSPNSFSSLSIMYEGLLHFLKTNYEDKDLIKIRRQSKSIGLLYKIGEKDYKIDIVPCKYPKGNHNSKTAGYLHINKNSFFEDDSYTKTDISILKSLKLSKVQQDLVVSFKIWKNNFSVPISSHLLRLLIVDAYKKNNHNIPRSFTEKILMVTSHINDNILIRRIVSAENTNNVLTDISEFDKHEIKNACIKIIDDYNYQPNSLLRYFK